MAVMSYLFILFSVTFGIVNANSNTDLAFKDAVDPRNFTSDPYLPSFHFVPFPFNWLNDPNGPCYDPVHQLYHLFYQYQTPRVWGHAVSPNLIDWIQMPIALNLGAWYDSGGDYSGSASVLDDDARTIVLTVSSSSDHMFTAIAANRSDPYLAEWIYADDKDETGTSQPLFTPNTLSRDPTELLPLTEGGYQLFVGTGNGTALWQVDSTDNLYSLDAWYPRGYTLMNTNTPNIFWECPDIFKMPSSDSSDGVWVSKYSLDGLGDYFFTGDYDSSTGLFTPGIWDISQPQRYDTNDMFYASKTFYDVVQNRRVLWGWLHMQPWPVDPVVNLTGVTKGTTRKVTKDDDAGWQNTMGVPRELQQANQGGSLTTSPIPELDTLRDQSSLYSDTSSPFLTAPGLLPIDDISGVRLDITLQINYTATSEEEDILCGLRLFLDSSDSDSEFLDVLMPIDASFNGVFRPMRVLVDGSVVEAFYDGGDTHLGTAETFFYYPKTSSNSGIALVMQNNEKNEKESISSSCVFSDIKIWKMNPFKFDISYVQ
mmetsp:Transcript_6410/g.8303  ORF Transcript_6410/g.8303 Transcript_6410/m.8303 type:complete len:540 (-) Transcript_6410:12-1631(-)